MKSFVTNFICFCNKISNDQKVKKYFDKKIFNHVKYKSTQPTTNNPFPLVNLFFILHFTFFYLYRFPLSRNMKKKNENLMAKNLLLHPQSSISGMCMLEKFKANENSIFNRWIFSSKLFIVEWMKDNMRFLIQSHKMTIFILYRFFCHHTSSSSAINLSYFSFVQLFWRAVFLKSSLND